MKPLGEAKPSKGLKIFGVPWWASAGGTLLVASTASAAGTVAAVKVIDVVKNMSFKKGMATWEASISQASSKHGVPAEVIGLFISLESGWKVDEYNPEVGAMKKWACQIASDSKWRGNPDYQNAASVCDMLTRDASKAKALGSASKRGVSYQNKLWKFGSFGLGQMSAIGARGVGFAYERTNSDLFIPEVNIDLIGAFIARNKKALYPGRGTLTKDEWSKVRASYVGGIGILSRTNPKAVADRENTIAAFNKRSVSAGVFA